MLVDIQTFFLDDAVTTQTVNLVKDFEDNETSSETEYKDGSRTKCLYAQTGLYAVNLGIAEDANSNRSQNTTYAMNGHGTYGIVNLQNFVDETY